MSLTVREFWAVIHGMGLGAIFLLAFAGGLAGLWSLRPEWVTGAGIQERLRRLRDGTWIMAIVAWLTVITGTYIVYPWYRAKPLARATDLSLFPRSYLLANPNLAAWHTFGMEWKEHVAWLSPMLATAVAFVVVRYGPKLGDEEKIRRALIVLFTLAFAAAAVAGLFGAFINKVAPTR
ncbi:MAG: hypothetical protein HYV08_09440 [Deltaproteobacteria bacterium]|nr:hypothetical protein [Deltaproteobacteria bacterium]MBI3079143.1 hypothetical protein [Deltaproteobacteria bacterium]